MTKIELPTLPLDQEKEEVAFLASRNYDLTTKGNESTEDYVNDQLRANYNKAASHRERVQREYEGTDLELELNVAKALEKAVHSDAIEHYKYNKESLHSLALKENQQRANI